MSWISRWALGSFPSASIATCCRPYSRAKYPQVG